MNNEKNSVILHVILLKVELFRFSIYKRKTTQIDKTYVQLEAKLPIHSFGPLRETKLNKNIFETTLITKFFWLCINYVFLWTRKHYICSNRENKNAKALKIHSVILLCLFSFDRIFFLTEITVKTIKIDIVVISRSKSIIIRVLFSILRLLSF